MVVLWNQCTSSYTSEAAFHQLKITPSSGCVESAIWMHYMDADKMYEEKARQELHKNPTSCIEQILEVTLHKTAAMRQPTSHF